MVIRPSAQPPHPACGFLGDGRPQQRQGKRRSAVQACLAHLEATVVVDLLATPQPPHHLGRIAQCLLPLPLDWPRLAGDALVQGLAGTQRQPYPARRQLLESRRCLRHQCRVLAQHRAGHHAQGQRALHRQRAGPHPAVAGLPLRSRPWVEMVRAHHGLESRLFGAQRQAQQGGGRELLMRCVVADGHHGFRAGTGHDGNIPPAKTASWKRTLPASGIDAGLSQRATFQPGATARHRRCRVTKPAAYSMPATSPRMSR